MKTNRKKQKSIKLINNTLMVIAIFATMLSPATPVMAENFNDAEVKHIESPGWFKKSPFLDLADDLADSIASGKQGLMILFTTEGCSYCDAFIRKSLGNPEIASLVQNSFDSLGLEIFDDTEMTGPHNVSMSVKQFAEKEGVEFSPALLFYGEDGERVLKVVGYQSPERFKMILDYVTGKHYLNETLKDYLKRKTKKGTTAQSNYALKLDPLFAKPPYALNRSHFPAEQPLMVIFEQSACEECESFHTDVLAMNKVREVLKKFEIVRLDTKDEKTKVITPGGNKVNPASWYKLANFSRVPALLFFDEKGNEVLKTDSLVLHQRMVNALNFVLERAYEKGWSYQRFARTKGLEKQLKNSNRK